MFFERPLSIEIAMSVTTPATKVKSAARVVGMLLRLRVIFITFGFLECHASPPLSRE
jgi:hypothetical protein